MAGVEDEGLWRTPTGERTFIDRLRLDRIDRDIFTGFCHAAAPQRAFGGQVAAQALVAAGRTVDQADRTVHSLHGYFLRPGRTTDPIVYLVDRPRDGGSFSTRRVTAVQYGETIFMLSASFAPPFAGPEHQTTLWVDDPPDGSWIGHIPQPEGCAPMKLLQPDDVDAGPDREARLIARGYPVHDFIEMRQVDTDWVRSQGRADQMAWCRAKHRLPDDQLVQVCSLTYFSDLSLVSTVLDHHGGRPGTRGLQVTSIDHAMWFHRPFRADEWMLFVTNSPTSAAGRGFATGQFFRADGQTVASVAQEVLMRQPRPRT